MEGDYPGPPAGRTRQHPIKLHSAPVDAMGVYNFYLTEIKCGYRPYTK